MDERLSQTRLILNGDANDLYDEEDAGQKESMVLSLIFSDHFFLRTSILDDDDDDQKRDYGRLYRFF